jgi:flavin reductase (DIM6/NTAB) family NADH-FMN oxidoreductase RutF
MEVDLENAGLLFPTVATMAVTIDEKEEPNIITLGWAMKTSHDPPMVAISVKPSRYSHELLEEAREFVLSIPTMDIVEELHYCGRHSGRDAQKFQEMGLTQMAAKKVKPPLIKECAANLECKVISTLTTGDHTIFAGEIVAAHVQDDLFDDERNCLDLDKAKGIVTHSDEYRVVGKVEAYKLNGEMRKA